MTNQNTFTQRKEDVTREWHLVDAEGKILGRLASEIAQKLIGKHKPTFTPHIDGGDYVVVINADKIDFTGKPEQKIYYRHSGYVGNLKQENLTDLLQRAPEQAIERAVLNMLPKNKLRSPRMNRLKVYTGADHHHQSQFGNNKKD